MLALLAAGLVALSGRGEPPALTGEVSFDQVAAAVLRHHPELAALEWERQAREGTARQAGQWANPVAEVGAESIAGSGDFAGTQAMESSLTLSQEVPLAGKAAKRAAVARGEAELVHWDLAERRLALLGQARTAYAEVAVAQERLALAQAGERLVARLVEGVSQRAAAGEVSPVERTRAQVELGTAAVARRRAELELNGARLRLATRWGAAAATFTAVVPLAAPPSLPERAQLEAALAQHPRLQRWTAEQAVREAALGLAQAEAWPDLEVSAGITRYQESDDHAFTVAVGMPLPFFNRNRGAIAAAQAQLEQAAATRAAAWRELHGEALGSLAALHAQHGVMAELAQALLPQAEATYEAVRTAYAGGQGGLLELLDAERALLATRETLADAQHEFRLQQAALEALLGLSLTELPTLPVDTQKELR